MRKLLIIVFLIACYSGISSDSIPQIDSLINLTKQATGIKHFDALVKVGLEYDKLDSLNLAEYYYLQAIEYGNSQVEDMPIQVPAGFLGLVYMKTWKPEQAEVLFRQAILGAKDRNDYKTLLHSQANLAILFSKQLRLDSAELYLNEALYQAAKKDDTQAIISILNSLAFLKEKRGNISEAVQVYFEMEKKCNSGNFNYERAIIYNNLGNIYRLHDQRISLEYYKKASEIGRELKVNSLLSMVSLNISLCHIQNKNFQEAKRSLNETLFISKESGDSVCMIQAFSALAHIALKFNNESLSTAYLDSARFIAVKKPGTMGDYFIRIEQALLLISQKKYLIAKEMLESLSDEAEQAGIINTQAELYFNLYEVHKMMGQNDLALKYYEESLHLKDSILPDSLSSHLVRLHHQFLLNKENEGMELRMLEAKSKVTNLQLSVAIAITGMLIFGIGILYYRRKIAQLSVKEYHSLVKIEDLKMMLSQLTIKAEGAGDINLNEDVRFKQRLLQAYPELNTLELKICAMIRANFSTKKIAGELDKSIGTIDNYRSMIRKKMDLQEEESLSMILQDIV